MYKIFRKKIGDHLDYRPISFFIVLGKNYERTFFRQAQPGVQNNPKHTEKTFRSYQIFDTLDHSNLLMKIEHSESLRFNFWKLTLTIVISILRQTISRLTLI